MTHERPTKAALQDVPFAGPRPRPHINQVSQLPCFLSNQGLEELLDASSWMSNISKDFANSSGIDGLALVK